MSVPRSRTQDPGEPLLAEGLTQRGKPQVHLEMEDDRGGGQALMSPPVLLSLRSLQLVFNAAAAITLASMDDDLQSQSVGYPRSWAFASLASCMIRFPARDSMGQYARDGDENGKFKQRSSELGAGKGHTSHSRSTTN
eukprot:1098366-Pelagomonas_calceolata.AAC.4